MSGPKAAGPGGNPDRPGRAVSYLMDHPGIGACVAAVLGVVSLGGLALQLG